MSNLNEKIKKGLGGALSMASPFLGSKIVNKIDTWAKNKAEREVGIQPDKKRELIKQKLNPIKKRNPDPLLFIKRKDIKKS